MPDLKKIATELVASYRDKRPVGTPVVLSSHQEAYQIQKYVQEEFGYRVGWKIGLSPTGEFVRAPMFKRTTFVGEAKIKRDYFNHCLVESELAFVFKASVSAKNGNYSLEDILPFIDSVHAGIEFCDSRLAGWPACDFNWQLADSLTHGGYVLGGGVKMNSMDSFNLMKQASFRILIGLDSSEPRIAKAENRAHPFNDPLPILLWLANELIAQGDAINAGDIITTGSFSGSDAVFKNEMVSVLFEGIGEAKLIIE